MRWLERCEECLLSMPFHHWEERRCGDLEKKMIAWHYLERDKRSFSFIFHVCAHCSLHLSRQGECHQQQWQKHSPSPAVQAFTGCGCIASNHKFGCTEKTTITGLVFDTLDSQRTEKRDPMPEVAKSWILRHVHRSHLQVVRNRWARLPAMESFPEIDLRSAFRKLKRPEQNRRCPAKGCGSPRHLRPSSVLWFAWAECQLEMKWYNINEMKWSKMRWNEVKWCEMRWNEVKWGEMK